MRPYIRRGQPMAQGRFRGVLRGLVGACAGVLLVGLALACDTPVYRYAMYRWPPAPYHVLYFHRGSPDAKDGEVNRMLDEAGTKATPANLSFESVDVSKDETLKFLPEEIRSVWQAHRQEPLPRHVILAPRMGELWSGRLDVAETERLLQSPLRTKIAQLLHDGHAAVLILLPGSDAAATRKAEQVINEAIAQVASGGQGQSPSAGSAPDAKDATAQRPGAETGDTPQPAQPLPLSAADLDAATEGPKPLRLALVKLDRKDAKEQWLLRNLLAIQKIPPEKEKEPLLYAVFGRGRAMGPCLGDQISSDSIDELVAFLGGACSCVIKDQNPGVDLLFAWDWDATAEHLVQNEEPAPVAGPDYAEIPADMPLVPAGGLGQPVTGEGCCPAPGLGSPAVADAPGSPAAGTARTGSASTIPGSEDAQAGTVGTAAAAGPAGSGNSGAGAGGGGESRLAQNTGVADEGASLPAPLVSPALAMATDANQPSFASRQLWQFGVGMGVAAAVVLLAGVWILRKARYDTP